MKIANMFGQGRTVFSLEVFPPKKSSPVNSIFETLDGLRHIQPDFISVTFGAGGVDRFIGPIEQYLKTLA